MIMSEHTSIEGLNKMTQFVADDISAGDFKKCAKDVTYYASIFFPLSDGVISAIAHNAFKTAVYGMEEFSVGSNNKDYKIELTSYNLYQLFLQLAGNELKNPQIAYEKYKDKASKTIQLFNQNHIHGHTFDEKPTSQIPEVQFILDLNNEGLRNYEKCVKLKEKLWGGKNGKLALLVFFEIVSKLAQEPIKTLIMDSNSAMTALAVARQDVVKDGIAFLVNRLLSCVDSDDIIPEKRYDFLEFVTFLVNFYGENVFNEMTKK